MLQKQVLKNPQWSVDRGLYESMLSKFFLKPPHGKFGVLAMTKIVARDNSVTVIAGNLSSFLEMRLNEGVGVLAEGEFLIPHHSQDKHFSLVCGVTGDEIFFSITDKSELQMLSGYYFDDNGEIAETETDSDDGRTPLRFNCRLKGVFPGDEYPRLASLGGGESVLLHAEFVEAMRRVIYGAAKDATRPQLNGICLEYKPGLGVTLTSTDGFKLSHASTDYSADKPFRVVIPLDIAESVIKLYNPDEGDGTVEFFYFRDGNRIAFRQGNWTLRSLLPEGDFPEWEGIVKPGNKSITVSVAELKRAMASIAAMDYNKKKRVILRASEIDGEGELSLSLSDAEVGDGAASITCYLDGFSEETQFALNADYLSATLDACGGKEVCISFSTPQSPMRVTAPNDSNWFGIIMPMSVK